MRVTAVGASLIPRKSLVLSIFGVLERERKQGREAEREREEIVMKTY